MCRAAAAGGVLLTPLAEPARKLLGPVFAPVRDLFWSVFAFTERTAVVWLAVYVALAFAVFVRRERKPEEPLGRGFLRYLLPAEIYRHPSAKADCAFFVVEKILAVAALGVLSVSASWVAQSLLRAFPAAPQPPRLWACLLLTAASLLAYDFASFLWHYLTHRIPVLWAFHRVHHAAERLTPLSNYREHPVDSQGRALFQAGLIGATQAAVIHLLPSARPLELWGQNLLYVPFYVFINARHSHVWLSFGPFWERIVSSPAQHQCHHGTAPEHIDVNYGFVFSIWDRLFGTLYVPAGRETVRYGLVGEERPFPTVLSMYVRPFGDAWRRLRGRAAAKSHPAPAVT